MSELSQKTKKQLDEKIANELKTTKLITNNFTYYDPMLTFLEIEKISGKDKRTIKSYCQKLSIPFSAEGIPIKCLLELLQNNAKTYDGRRSKGKFKIDVKEEYPEELQKEIKRYEKDPFAPKGSIHKEDPILFKSYWEAYQKWTQSQVQSNKYISVADVKETMYLTLTKFKEYFKNLQDKVDSAFPDNPAVQMTASVFIKETLIDIYDDLIKSVDEFKLESDYQEKYEEEKGEIMEAAQVLYEEYLEENNSLKKQDQDNLSEKIEKTFDDEISDESFNINEPTLQ